MSKAGNRVKLGELLVKSNMITVNQLAQALKAQSIYGGRLGTNLVEMGLVTETQIANFLAKQLHIAAATLTDFENIQPDVVKLIKPEFAVRHLVIPLALEKNKLVAAFCDPLDLSVREEAAFYAGYPIVPKVAPELLLNHALERHYGATIARHVVKIADAVEDGIEDIDAVLVRAHAEEIDDTQEELNEQFKDILSKQKPTPRVAENPFALSPLCEGFLKAKSAEHVFRALYRFLSPRYGRIAVFMLRQQAIWGWWHEGFPIDQATFREHLLNVYELSAIAKVFREKDTELTPQFTDIDRRLLHRLGANLEVSHQIFPMHLAGRVVTFLLENSDSPAAGAALTPETVQDALMRGSIGLQMVSLRRKLFANL